MSPSKTPFIAAALAALAFGAHAQGNAPIKVGFMLPYSGTYAALGNDQAASLLQDELTKYQYAGNLSVIWG